MSELNVHMNKLVKGTGILVIFGIYSYIINFLFKLIVARHYGSSDFGLFILAQTIFCILVLLAGLGVKESIVRYIPYYVTKNKKSVLSGYLTFIFILPVIFSFILSFLLFIFAENVSVFFNFPAKFTLFLKLIAIVIPFSTFNGIIKKIFLAEHKPWHNAISYHFIENTVLLLGSCLIIYLNLPVVYLIIVLLISILMSAIYNVLIYKIKIHLPIIKTKTFLIKEWFNFSLPLFFTGVFAYIISWSDNLVIGKFLEPSQLGIYSICYSLAIFLVFFQTAFANLFVPLISSNYAKKKFENILFLFKHSAAWTFGLTFPFFLVILLFSKQILLVLYGSEFVSGYSVLIIISIGALINISTGLNKEILLLYKKTKFIFLVNVCIATSNIMMNILLIPVLGIIGAAITSAASISAQNLVFLIKAKQYQKLKFNFKYNLKFLIAGLPSIFIARMVFDLFANKTLEILFAGTVYLILYVSLLLLLRTPTKEDIRILLLVERKSGINLEFIKSVLRKIY